jgi:DNA-binding Lrp family transcriptional regulator
MPHTLAYVLINASSGRALDAAKAIEGIEGIRTAHAVTGIYDIICLVEAESLEVLANTVVDQIQAVDGVERTQTALVVHAH